MNETDEPATDDTPKRGRPPGRPAKLAAKPRRNHAAELTALQGRVDTALRLLRRVTGNAVGNSQLGDAARELISVALETLEATE